MTLDRGQSLEPAPWDLLVSDLRRLLEGSVRVAAGEPEEVAGLLAARPRLERFPATTERDLWCARVESAWRGLDPGRLQRALEEGVRLDFWLEEAGNLAAAVGSAAERAADDRGVPQAALRLFRRLDQDRLSVLGASRHSSAMAIRAWIDRRRADVERAADWYEGHLSLFLDVALHAGRHLDEFDPDLAEVDPELAETFDIYVLLCAFADRVDEEASIEPEVLKGAGSWRRCLLSAPLAIAAAAGEPATAPRSYIWRGPDGRSRAHLDVPRGGLGGRDARIVLPARLAADRLRWLGVEARIEAGTAILPGNLVREAAARWPGGGALKIRGASGGWEAWPLVDPEPSDEP